MIGNILDNTTELYMIKYTFGEIFSSCGATLCKNPSEQTVSDGSWTWNVFERILNLISTEKGYSSTCSSSFILIIQYIVKKALSLLYINIKNMMCIGTFDWSHW